jgi:hypothetical protein
MIVVSNVKPSVIKVTITMPAMPILDTVSAREISTVKLDVANRAGDIPV